MLEEDLARGLRHRLIAAELVESDEIADVEDDDVIAAFTQGHEPAAIEAAMVDATGIADFLERLGPPGLPSSEVVTCMTGAVFADAILMIVQGSDKRISEAEAREILEAVAAEARDVERAICQARCACPVLKRF